MTIRPILLILISENLYQIFFHIFETNWIRQVLLSHIRNIIFFVISLNKLNKACFTFSYQKYQIFVISLKKLNRKIVRRWHRQLTCLLICIECSRNVSWNIAELYNVNFLIWNPIFTVLFETIYSFYWINLNFDWTYPLKSERDKERAREIEEREKIAMHY